MSKFLKKTPLYIKIAASIILIIAIYFIFFGSGSSVVADSITVVPTNFVQKLSVTGTVEASQTADLGFAQSGRISSVNVKVGDSVKKGDMLASIENGDLRAVLLQRQAILTKERSNLSTKQIGTRPEELAITKQKYSDAVSAYIGSLHSAYLKTEEAFLTYADITFLNGSSVSPGLQSILQISTNSVDQRLSIENKRLKISEGISEWKILVAILDQNSIGNGTTDLDKAGKIADDTLNLAKSLINDLSRLTASMSTSQGYSQTLVNSYRTGISNAGDLVGAASADINASRTAMNTAENSLFLEKSGYTVNEISAQQASVSAAEADVLNAQAQLDKSIVRAPFDGIITRMDAKIGEIASANTSNISINSTDTYIIKSNVPEVYISNLSVGDKASTTLDAYGTSVSFPLEVTAIDPAQTVVNGVSNYKTTLQFLTKDKRIRPGMTANIDITTKDIPNTFVIPLGSIINKNGAQYVQIRQNNKILEREVKTGAISTVGMAQVLSGLVENDQVILNPKAL
jgi:RND family efflux transporter MFP subunit